MNTRRIIDTNRILQVETTMVADRQLLEHLSSTVLGTPGRLRYQLTNINEKLARTKKIHFLLLTRQEKILGSVGFIYRSTRCNNSAFKSWYIRYFSIKAPLRAKAHKNENFRDKDKGSTLVRDIAMPYMENPSRLDENFDPTERSLVYGYVESANFRSMNFSEQMQALTVRKYKTFIFSRLFLRKVTGFRKLEKNEVNEFRQKVADSYGEYCLFTDENLFIKDNYFVLERGGEVVIGAQVHPEFWKVLDMKGRFSRLMLRILPSIPYIRRFFNPEAFRFMALEGIWYKKGGEVYINDLLNGICNHFQTHFALTWADSDSKLYRDLDANMDFGLIGNSFERVEADVRVTFNNFTEEEKQEFFNRPSYISAYDMV